MVEQHDTNVKVACRLFGHCRQAYYQLKTDYEEECKRNGELVDAVKEIREEDPGIGCFKLFIMICCVFGRDRVPGRDNFFKLLRRNKLMLNRPKPRHTTNSNHRYHKYKNLIKGFVPTGPNQLWVSDITYIGMNIGCCYLHLITDAYSHKIIGWKLADTLKAAITLDVLSDAISQTGLDDLTGLIHHSDRGVQYCCDIYIKKLNEYNITISMTEEYKPTDNAIAERINGIIKQERIYREKHFNNIDQARSVIGRYISFYNTRRPHMSIGMLTPEVVHQQTGEQKRMWKTKVYSSRKTDILNNDVLLSTQQ